MGRSAEWPAAPSSLSSATAGSAATRRARRADAAAARLAHRVVWVNPHRGKAGYEPVQQGIAAALPHCRRLRRGPLAERPSPRWWRWWAVREVLPELMRVVAAGETVGVGTVVATWRSAPRPAGRLDARRTGRRGGRLGLRRLRRGRGLRARAAVVVAGGAPVLQRYGVSDDDAFAVGLTCGGILDVYVEKVNQQTFPELGEVADDIEAGRPVAVATVIEHPDPERVGRRVVVRPEDATARLARQRARRRRGRRRRPRPAGRRPQRDPDLRPRRRAPRRGHAGLRLGVRAARRGCWSSAPSTSRPRSRGSARSSATR